jgi:hypothetical protein
VVAVKMAGVVNPDGRPAERGARVEPVAWGRPGAPQPGCGAELALRSVGTDPGSGVTRRAAPARAAQAEQAEGRPAMGAQACLPCLPTGRRQAGGAGPR